MLIVDEMSVDLDGTCSCHTLAPLSIFDRFLGSELQLLNLLRTFSYIEFGL
jgi:hypothetical protein